MKKATLASFFHVALSKTNNNHKHCPKRENSWCRFTTVKNKNKITYKPGLPIDINVKTMPLYLDLTKDNKLGKVSSW